MGTKEQATIDTIERLIDSLGEEGREKVALYAQGVCPDCGGDGILLDDGAPADEDPRIQCPRCDQGGPPFGAAVNRLARQRAALRAALLPSTPFGNAVPDEVLADWLEERGYVEEAEYLRG
jgi:hypothetical protein